MVYFDADQTLTFIRVLVFKGGIRTEALNWGLFLTAFTTQHLPRRGGGTLLVLFIGLWIDAEHRPTARAPPGRNTGSPGRTLMVGVGVGAGVTAGLTGKVVGDTVAIGAERAGVLVTEA